MRSLTRLEMARLPKITDEGLLSLGGLEELRSLDLSHTDQLTRTGVVALQSLTNLTQLKCVRLPGNLAVVCDMENLFGDLLLQMMCRCIKELEAFRF